MCRQCRDVVELTDCTFVKPNYALTYILPIDLQERSWKIFDHLLL